MHGEVDVVVCDGFTGNVILKLTEGVAKMLLGMLKQMFLQTSAGNSLPAAQGRRGRPEAPDGQRGGTAAHRSWAPQPVIKAHGSSNAKGIKNAIRQAKICVENDLCGTMGQRWLHEGEADAGSCPLAAGPRIKNTARKRAIKRLRACPAPRQPEERI